MTDSVRAVPVVKLQKEPESWYEPTKKKPHRMTDREIYNSLCDCGQDGDFCKECKLCKFGLEYIKRGFKGKREKRRY